jgi:hypothetical protein
MMVGIWKEKGVSVVRQYTRLVEKLAPVYQIARCHVPEDRSLDTHLCGEPQISRNAGLGSGTNFVLIKRHVMEA